MNFAVPQFTAFILAWFGIMGGIWALFDRAETVLRPDVRERLSAWLRNDRTDANLKNWPRTFASIFDQVFGARHLSWKCFRRSCIASIVCVVIMSLIVTATVEGVWHGTYFADQRWMVGAGLFILVTSLTNLIPDYLSLLETRLVISYMARGGMLRWTIALFVDFALTALIFTIAFTFGVTALYMIISDESISSLLEQIDTLPESLYSGVLFWKSDDGHGDELIAIWLYSTGFTSLWVWLFFFSSLVVKGINGVGLSVRSLGRLFDTEEKPLRSLGFICMLMVTIVFVVVLFL